MSDIQHMEMISALTIMTTMIAILIMLNICKKRISRAICSIVILALAVYIKVECNTLNVTAKIRANHWGIKLLTVENDAGYRANLYNCNFLVALVNGGIINIKGVTYHSNQFEHRMSVRYDKSVLNYNAIEKSNTWDKYTDGFKPINRGIGGDYIHPSMY